MQPLFEYRHELAGHTTRVLELEGDGPPFLLVHGYADSADTWRLTLDRLARAERRALALDLPGFGRASTLRPGEILPQLDAVADAALDELGEPAVVVGNSLGGTVALRAAERHPELVATVPVAPAGLDMAPWFGLIERDPLLRSLLAVPVPLPGPVVRETVGRVYRALAFRDQRAVEPNVVKLFTSHHPDRVTIARYLATGRRLLPELRDPFRLERIAGPVHVVWGTKDRMVMSSGAQRLVEEVADVRVELLDGCGHCPQIERADEVARLLLALPEGVAPVAGR